MTPHEALSHAMTPHQGEPWKYWTAALPHTLAQVVCRADANRYDLFAFPAAAAMRPALRSERCGTAREVLTGLRIWFTEESADTTRIDHALAELREP